jgi:peptidoglycan/LPS O-acetylase OafA/YrhL
MSSDQRPPDARPVFRRLAVGVAVVCFALAGVFGFVADENKLFAVGVCLAVGAMMAVIGVTGYWPPRKKP